MENNFKKIMNAGFKGIWIPREIILDKRLKPVEKLILMEIHNLSRNKPCFATNAHFGEIVGLKTKRVGQILSHLTELGYIRAEGANNVAGRVLISNLAREDSTSHHERMSRGVGRILREIDTEIPF